MTFHGRFAGGHAEEFVQLTDPERLVGVGVEGVDDDLAGGGQLRRFAFGSCQCDFCDDLSGSGQIGKPSFGFDQSGGQVLYLVA
ncbi:hypothetical protein [Streptomyces sp. NBC_01092]|uniref:hypothetical protein n=1 Tax=Streptomyces sp. NBC_01092 TaxID=2903748 RepID=UPI00386E9AAA|nr:hypothetical protein OG254_01065 [Streptomyces sp. NBC_01092]